MYESHILDTTYAGDGQQDPTVDPLMAYIPTGTTVTIIQAVKKLTVGPVDLDGYGAGFPIEGSATAKPRNIILNGPAIRNSCAYDMDIDAVDGLIVRGVRFSDSARRGVSYSNYLWGDAENFRISDCHWDDTCWRVRFGIYLDDGASKGIIEPNILRESGRNSLQIS